MFANILAAALRNLARNRLYAAISIGGLAIGMAAALLTLLFIRDELTFDSFIPGYRNVQVLASEVRTPGRAPTIMDYAPEQTAGWLRSMIGDVTIARLGFDRVLIRRGAEEFSQDIAWVDPDFFRVLPLPVERGDTTALTRPDALALTQSMARKVFGREDVVGEPLQLGGHLMRVAAVLRDLPSGTHLTHQVFASAVNQASLLSRIEHEPFPPGFNNVVINPSGSGPRIQPVRVRVYVRMRGPGQGRILQRALTDLSTQHAKQLEPIAGSAVTITGVPLPDLHLYPFTGSNTDIDAPQGSVSALYAMGIIAGLILFIAAVNFVNLTTARATRRAVEVGVRKVAGAQRGQLIVQFIGEGVLQAVVALVLALALVELALPVLSAVMLRQISFPYWRSPGAIAAAIGVVLVIGAITGAYPALILSAFRPASVLKGLNVSASGSGLVRGGLVTMQFAALIGLMLATAVVWRQTHFALTQAMTSGGNPVLVISASPCRGAFADEVRKLPGVQAAACSSPQPLGMTDITDLANDFDSLAGRPGGQTVPLGLGLTDYGFFEVHGIRPLAGRLFSKDQAGDELPAMTSGSRSGTMILNFAAVRRLGFPSPAAAVGSAVDLGSGDKDHFRVVGVTPDFTVDLLHGPAVPTAYLVDFGSYPLRQLLNVRLDGRRIPETLASIDGLWRQSGHADPMRRQFLEDYVQRIYIGTIRQGWLLSATSGVALLIGSLGLFGLAAFTVEQRTKEIGIRKAMGASTSDVAWLLLWSFVKPVLWANLIAWPVGAWIMNLWLQSFSAHIALSPLLFVAAGLGALLIAAATVTGQAVRVAAANPVAALRYE